MLERTGVDPATVDAVLMGQVLQAGQGQITARQAAVKAGIPMTVHATTINKVCLSGLQTIYLADLMIRAGEAEIVVAGGMESMTDAPYLLPGARAGYRIGDQKVVDSMMFDGLTCAFDHCAMGLSTERHNAGPDLAGPPGRVRRAQPPAGRGGHRRGTLRRRDRRGAPCPSARATRSWSATDEGVRADTTVESLGRPAPGLRQGRHHHRRQRLADLRRRRGGARDVGRARGRARASTPIGEIVGYGQVAGPDASLLTQPSRAIAKAAARAGLDADGLDLFEINEAFAAVGLASADDLGIDESKINVNGGAIALGHPVGMSGTRLALTALAELRRRGGGVAAVALCGGGGQGDAAILRTL